MVESISKESFLHLLQDLRATHQSNLVSVVLYGSAAAGDHVKGRSDYNLLVVLHQITPEDLRLAQAPVREWRRMGHPVPVYFTAEEINRSADIFPIEFNQMKRARVVLHGADPFDGVEISLSDLRRQTEFELRSKLLQLRRHYIPASASTEKLLTLMSDSLKTFAVLFAPVLLLSGREPARSKRECADQITELLKLKPDTFEEIFNLRSKAASIISESAAHNIFASYLSHIEQVIRFVDQMDLA